MRRTLTGLLCALLVLLTAGCGQQKEDGKIGTDGPFTIYSFDCVEIALLTELKPQVEIEVLPDPEHGVLLEVYERASLDAARRDGVREPRDYGRVLQLLRFDKEGAQAAVEAGTLSPFDLQTRDQGGSYYAVTVAEESQFYRSGKPTDRDRKAWSQMVRLSVLAQGDFHWRNDDHTVLTAQEAGLEVAALPPVLQSLQSLKNGDLEVPVYPTWSREKMDQLAAALVRAAQEPVLNRADRAFGPVTGQPDTWTLVAWWLRRDDCRIELGCSEAEEPLVSVSLWDTNMLDAICLRDQELYDLVRYSRDGIPEVNARAEEKLWYILNDAREQILLDHADNPGRFTTCNLVQLTHNFIYEEADGARVEIYDVDFSLTPEAPEKIEWLRDMYLDGSKNVRGVSALGQLAVRYRDGEMTASAFLGEDHDCYPGPGGQASRDYADWLLNQAELSTINPLRVVWEDDADPAALAMCQYVEDSDAPTAARVLFLPEYSVSDFRYFAVETEEREDRLLFSPGELLYETDNLSPSWPVLVSLDMPETVPTRGVSFRIGEIRHAYTIALSGEDGSVLLVPIQ